MLNTPLSPFLRTIVFAAAAMLAAPSFAQSDASSLSDSGLDETTLYELLVGEIALQRGDAALAAQTYAELARSTRDPRIVRRAIEVANFAHQPELALEAAKLWSDMEPKSPQPLQVIAAILIGAKRVDEAAP